MDLHMIYEWRGAHDGYLAYQKEKDEPMFHRSGDMIVGEPRQPKEYGPVFFTTIGKDGVTREWRNLLEVEPK